MVAKIPKNSGIDTDDLFDAFQRPKAPVVGINSVNRDQNELSTLAKAGIQAGQLPVSHIHQTPSSAPIPEQPSVLSQAAGVAGGVVSGVTNVAMLGAGFAPMVVPVLDGGAKLVEKVGKATGIEFVENHGKNTSARITKFTERTFADVMPKNRLTKAIAAGTNRIFNTLGGTIEKGAELTGVNKPLVKSTANEIKSLTKSIGKSNVLHGAMNTSFIAGSALSTAGVVKGLGQGIATLKEMEMDITGRDVSTFDILFGKLSKPTAEAKSQLLKSSSLFGVTDVASLSVAVLSTVKNTVSPLAFFIPQLVSMAGGTVLGESIIPEYKAFKQAHASGQEIPVDNYANFIGQASPVLRERGGASSVFTQKLAEQYSAQRVAPQEIMKRISNGTLEKDVKAMIAQAEAEKKAAEKSMAAAVPAIDTTAHSHVAALQGKHTAQPAQDVVGKHTAKIVADAAAAKHALGQTLPAGA